MPSIPTYPANIRTDIFMILFPAPFGRRSVASLKTWYFATANIISQKMNLGSNDKLSCW
ncbi:hypothetical protein CGRA01v4_14578 [Colletotrichum graminicola]|nr:hypothetical protein CGRA01v4_14578 [Colletotrichum graminicola]